MKVTVYFKAKCMPLFGKVYEKIMSEAYDSIDEIPEELDIDWAEPAEQKPKKKRWFSSIMGITEPETATCFGDMDGDIAMVRYPANYIATDPVAMAKAWLENGKVGEVCNELSAHNLMLCDPGRDWEPDYADFNFNKKKWG